MSGNKWGLEPLLTHTINLDKKLPAGIKKKGTEESRRGDRDVREINTATTPETEKIKTGATIIRGIFKNFWTSILNEWIPECGSHVPTAPIGERKDRLSWYWETVERLGPCRQQKKLCVDRDGGKGIVSQKGRRDGTFLLLAVGEGGAQETFLRGGLRVKIHLSWEQKTTFSQGDS